VLPNFNRVRLSVEADQFKPVVAIEIERLHLRWWSVGSDDLPSGRKCAVSVSLIHQAAPRHSADQVELSVTIPVDDASEIATAGRYGVRYGKGKASPFKSANCSPSGRSPTG